MLLLALTGCAPQPVIYGTDVALHAGRRTGNDTMCRQPSEFLRVAYMDGSASTRRVSSDSRSPTKDGRSTCPARP
jgi:hypothetical protein